MRIGWTLKEAAPVLGIKNERSVSQALDPAVRKLALLFRADALRTMDMLISTVRELEAEERDQRPEP